MKLTDLNPEFVSAGGEGVRDKNGVPVPERTGVGVILDCPCGRCEHRLYVPFANPLDGGPQVGTMGWQRTGDTFETLSTQPSILRKSFGNHVSCGWHGYITNGEIITV